MVKWRAIIPRLGNQREALRERPSSPSVSRRMVKTSKPTIRVKVVSEYRNGKRKRLATARSFFVQNNTARYEVIASQVLSYIEPDESALLR
jgi:hypothetical protein